MPPQQQNSSTSRGGIAPHFKNDIEAIGSLYVLHALTHSEMRDAVRKCGLDLDEWPENYPKPMMYGVWPEIGDDNPDNPDELPMRFFIPEINDAPNDAQHEEATA